MRGNAHRMAMLVLGGSLVFGATPASAAFHF